MTISRPVRVVVVDASSMVDVVGGDPVWVGRFAGWQDSGAMLLAPPHFRVEMANALLRSVRLETADVLVRLERLFRAGVDVVDRGMMGLMDAVEVAARHGLSVYDAAYLSMAMDLEAELATRDRVLARAARAEGVEVID